jgi:parvulin-like peptidyl-prolyl isomerase
MGKKKPTLAKPPQRMTKKERSRWEREKRTQRTFIAVLVAIGVVSVIVLVFGLLYDQIWYPNGVIAAVNGEQLHRSDYWNARRMDLINQWQQIYQNVQLYQSMGITLTKDQQDQIASQLNQVRSQLVRVKTETPDDTVMQKLIEETAVFQGASELGITATDEEADAFLLPGPQPVTSTSPFGSTPLTVTLPTTQTQPTPTPVNTLTPQERASQLFTGVGNFYAALREDLRAAGIGSLGFTQDDYLTMVRRSARLSVVEQKVKDKLAEGLPKEEEQVQVMHILIQDRLSRAQQAYQAAQQAVSTGASLAKTVVQYSDDTASRDRVGEVEIRRGEVSPQLEEAAFALSAADPLSGVVEDTAGVHVLKFVRSNDAAGSVVVQHILFPADRKSVADQVWTSVSAQPTTFSQVATTTSEDKKTAASGGDLGWITKNDGQLSPLVEASAFALTQTNSVSAPIDDDIGYHILQLVERDNANNRVHMRQILILKPTGLAQKVLDDVRGGQDFTEAVVNYSQDKASLDLAGDIGWVTRQDQLLSSEVISAAFALTVPNSLSPVVEDSVGYHIVQLVEPPDTVGNRVHIRHILVKRADVLLNELRDYIVSGDANTMVNRFMDAALKYSDDTTSKSKGGELGWFGRGKDATTTEIEDKAFAMQPGDVSDVFQGASGWHLIWVRAHEMNHPIDKATLDTKAQAALDSWKTETLQKATIVRYPPSTPTPTPLPPPFVPTLAPTTEPTTEPITGTTTP